MAELAELVSEMTDDIDGAARFGSLPFTGDQLRASYRDHVRRFGVASALADARIRYQAQIEGHVLPLGHETTAADPQRVAAAPAATTPSAGTGRQE